MRTTFAALALIGVLFSGVSFAMSWPPARPHKDSPKVVTQTELSTHVVVTGVPQSSSLLAPPL